MNEWTILSIKTFWGGFVSTLFFGPIALAIGVSAGYWILKLFGVLGG
jgi:hypothetical protein